MATDTNCYYYAWIALTDRNPGSPTVVSPG